MGTTDKEMGDDDNREQSGGGVADGECGGGKPYLTPEDIGGRGYTAEEQAAAVEEAERHLKEAGAVPEALREAFREEAAAKALQALASWHPDYKQERKEDGPGKARRKGRARKEGGAPAGGEGAGEGAGSGVPEGQGRGDLRDFLGRWSARQGCVVTANWAVLLGDCRDYLRELGPVDHVITDPPFSEQTHSRVGFEGRSDGMEVRAKLTFEPLTLGDVAYYGHLFRSVLRRWCVCFADEFTLGWWTVCGLEWVRAGIWYKPDGMPQMSGDRPGVGYEHMAILHGLRKAGDGRLQWNGGGRTAVWSHCAKNPRGRAEKSHPTEKPEALMLDLVRDFTDPGDIILDPFAGSGTTGVAALRLGRRCILIERDEAYARTCVERLTAEEQGSTLQALRAGQMALWR